MEQKKHSPRYKKLQNIILIYKIFKKSNPS